jgi:hypothetical protein
MTVFLSEYKGVESMSIGLSSYRSGEERVESRKKPVIRDQSPVTSDQWLIPTGRGEEIKNKKAVTGAKRRVAKRKRGRGR